MKFNLFPAETYSSRRQQLATAVNKGLILLPGNTESSMNYKDNQYPFRQDSSFLYYAGLDIPGLVLIIDTDNGTTTLFGNELSMDDIIWTGPLPSLQEQAAAVGITSIQPLSQVGSVLSKARDKKQTIHILDPYRGDTAIQLSEWLGVNTPALASFVSEPLIRAIVQQREIKETAEVSELHEANSISADMHVAGMELTREGLYEYEIAARVESIALSGNGRLAYPIILSVNGQTLHNHYHGNKLDSGRMILCDAGAENGKHYAGDLTRTFPVAKRFSVQQKEVYEVVLDSMNHAISLLRPGITFREVHKQAAIWIVAGLKNIGLINGDVNEAVEAGVHTLFFPHGLGHMIGLDVHDMENLGENFVGYTDTMHRSKEFGWKSLRLAKELKQGFVLTIEPGIYFIPELIAKWSSEKKLEEFINYKSLESYLSFGGIRIEDNFLITADGSQKLGKHLAKTVKELEELRG
ncbi:aminopeptidase P family protein [Terrimonas sp. NA20]|uniref:Xaa-Pro aminopeptidase n=1 Tax=Terrimonas ginsenosidimutans TaxID=2908004 RepID=A0ABS9KKT7_9BACT|nr:aminopeptidase P family protein [Terrimonas ginsenosidimutans]MCG2612937.1 aminopeptidase P family protein [Terrimonas ginsenosidimutans]